MKLHLKIFLFLVTLILSLFPSTTTSAVWNGTSALGDKRAVPLFGYPRGSCGGSAFLYAPRIVFTAAHGLFAGSDFQVANTDANRRNRMWVGYPGDKISFASRRVESEVILIAPNYSGRDAWLGGKRITRNNDFAIIILKEPLPVDEKKVELLTPELHNQYIQDETLVTLVGYGAQKASEVGSNSNCEFEREPMKYDSSVTSKEIYPGDQIWTAPLNFKSMPGKPSGCDGDSGGGYVKVLEDKYIYLGAAGAGGLQTHNCESYEPFLIKDGIMGSWPIYLYLDLIKEAEDYVLAHPIKVNLETKNTKIEKTSISCKKGKLVKVFQKTIAKCPKGYKRVA